MFRDFDIGGVEVKFFNAELAYRRFRIAHISAPSSFGVFTYSVRFVIEGVLFCPILIAFGLVGQFHGGRKHNDTIAFYDVELRLLPACQNVFRSFSLFTIANQLLICFP